MAVIEGGLSAALLDVGANTKAGRFQIRPDDVGVLGSYSQANLSGTMAAGLAAGSTIVSCRWGDATRAMLLRHIGFAARNAGTAFAAGVFLFEMLVARNFTASDSGGSSILPAGNASKRRTSFGTTLITDLRASTTGALTAGTRTLDTYPITLIRGYVPATQVNYPMVSQGGTASTPGASTTAFSLDFFDLWTMDNANEWPLVLVQNEGFIIRATVPATGTWEFGILLEWEEIATTEGYN